MIEASCLTAGMVLLALAGPATADKPAAVEVRLVAHQTERRVDVLAGGQPFTSYRWEPALKKPVLYPLRTPRGTPVTRGFPLEPRPGERVDHPHHIGLWLNYGDVNGIDFWNNSDARPPRELAHMGTVVHRRLVRAEGGPGRGELEVEAEWRGPDGVALLDERTRYVFRADPESRVVDRETVLTARGRVVFGDNKEGLLGLRVARALEHPADKPELFTDASGRPTTVPVLDNTGVTGAYLSSEGARGDAVWGTRGRWVGLSGRLGDESVTVAILDHPGNPGHPTHWHARGYGLFAANSLGAKVFRPEEPEARLVLEPKQSVTFRYRVLIRSSPATAAEMDEAYRRYSNQR